MKKLYIICIVFIIACCCAGCSNLIEKPERDVETISETNEFDLCYSTIRDYLNINNEDEAFRYISAHGGERFDMQKPISLYWISDGSGEYTILLDDVAGCVSSVSFSVDNPAERGEEIKYKLPGILVPGTLYRYSIRSKNGIVKEDSFFTKDAPVRYISFKGGWNTRDLGGWKTDTGEMINYGLIYRGRVPVALSNKDKKILLDYCGIKTQIDLRLPKEVENNPGKIDESIAYINTWLPPYTWIFSRNCEAAYDADHSNAAYEALQKIFSVLADENNYPIYFHCAAGADRTGTLAFLINGLCGVSYEDLTKDYEITTFSITGVRARGKLLQNGFSKDGIFQDDTGNYVAWGKLFEMMMNYYATPSGKLSDAIENYLVNIAGVSHEDVNKIKDTLIK